MRKNLDYGVLHAMTAFVRVVDAGSFTAAASQLELTTAQISRLVTDLEKRLQIKLLQRTTRRLALTGEGERYLAQARTILELVEEAENMAAESSVQPSGRLRLLCMTSFGNRYVVPLVAKYCTLFPKVTVEYSTSQDMPDLLAEGTDVSIYLAQHLPDSALVSQQLGTTFGVLCAAPQYLADHGAPTHPKELDNHACLRLVNPSLTPQWDLINGEDTSTIRPTGPIVGDIPEVVLHGVESALGIAMLPAYVVVDALKAGRLVHVLPGWKSPEIGVYLLRPSRRYVDAKTRHWIELVKTDLTAALDLDAEFFSQQQPHTRSRRLP